MHAAGGGTWLSQMLLPGVPPHAAAVTPKRAMTRWATRIAPMIRQSRAKPRISASISAFDHFLVALPTPTHRGTGACAARSARCPGPRGPGHASSRACTKLLWAGVGRTAVQGCSGLPAQRDLVEHHHHERDDHEPGDLEVLVGAARHHPERLVLGGRDRNRDADAHE